MVATPAPSASKLKLKWNCDFPLYCPVSSFMKIRVAIPHSPHMLGGRHRRTGGRSYIIQQCECVWKPDKEGVSTLYASVWICCEYGPCIQQAWPHSSPDTDTCIRYQVATTVSELAFCTPLNIKQNHYISKHTDLKETQRWHSGTNLTSTDANHGLHNHLIHFSCTIVLTRQHSGHCTERQQTRHEERERGRDDEGRYKVSQM